jgi:hypothetical protein
MIELVVEVGFGEGVEAEEEGEGECCEGAILSS